MSTLIVLIIRSVFLFLQLNSEYPDSAGGTVTVSESFKKVTRTVSLNKYKRTVKPAEGYEMMVWKYMIVCGYFSLSLSFS